MRLSGAIRSLSVAALVAVVSVAGSSAIAGTIGIFDNEAEAGGEYPAATGDGILRTRITCTACSVMYSIGGSYFFEANDGSVETPTYDVGLGAYDYNSAEFGEAFNDIGPGNNPENEAAWFSTLGFGTFTATDADKTDNLSDGTYSSAYLYVLLKIGNAPDFVVLRNESSASDGVFSFTTDNSNTPGQGGELSHFTGLGDYCELTDNCGPPVTFVPVPGSLPLLAGGLGLIGLYMRRKQKA